MTQGTPDWALAEVRHNEAGNARFSEGALRDAIAEYSLAQVAEPDRRRNGAGGAGPQDGETSAGSANMV
jgi:hypothetical protein